MFQNKLEYKYELFPVRSTCYSILIQGNNNQKLFFVIQFLFPETINEVSLGKREDNLIRKIFRYGQIVLWILLFRKKELEFK